MSRKQQQLELDIATANQTIADLKRTNAKLTKDLNEALKLGDEWKTKCTQLQHAPPVTLDNDILIQKIVAAKLDEFKTKMDQEREKQKLAMEDLTIKNNCLTMVNRFLIDDISRMSSSLSVTKTQTTIPVAHPSPPQKKPNNQSQTTAPLLVPTTTKQRTDVEEIEVEKELAALTLQQQ
jgi:hypothetical protein